MDLLVFKGCPKREGLDFDEIVSSFLFFIKISSNRFTLPIVTICEFEIDNQMLKLLYCMNILKNKIYI